MTQPSSFHTHQGTGCCLFIRCLHCGNFPRPFALSALVLSATAGRIVAMDLPLIPFHVFRTQSPLLLPRCLLADSRVPGPRANASPYPRGKKNIHMRRRSPYQGLIIKMHTTCTLEYGIAIPRPQQTRRPKRFTYVYRWKPSHRWINGSLYANT